MAVTTAKENYFSRLAKDITSNPKAFWSYLRKTRKETISIPKIVHEGTDITENSAKANHFNNYFKTIFLKQRSLEELPTYLVDIESAMPPITISLEGIRKSLDSLNESKATGPDEISPKVLKACSSIVSQYLYVIFRKSLESGRLPQDWKMTYVVPIHKNGPKSNVENYRPISLCCICCKIFEHILYSNITKHLEKNSFFYPNQHGFRQGLSCGTQLIELLHDLVTSAEDRLQTDAIFIDFRKAFDRVSHSLLMHKLRALRIDNNVLIWIEEYLSDRKQCVVVGGKKSGTEAVMSGVPQGSVLGPLLFLVYINDIVTTTSSCIRLFADDCVIYRTVSDFNDVSTLQKDLNNINSWCHTWELGLNTAKCYYVSFSKI